MNKHLYRVVFNHALGLFQVVSELVRRVGRGATQADSRTMAAVRPVSLGLWVAFGWIGFACIASASESPIAADKQAPGNQRPTVIGSSGNAPLINIQTPSGKGVSRNTYNRFDVGSDGAVLNNARTNTHTQLAGSVAGNPWLATGTAKVILNEVTGPHPSQLNGYIEVAGDRAQVVIANPSGIACDGCGFINANRVTLTTGTPMLNGGSLDGYRVSGGAIQVNGAGLDASRADYADIIARAVQVNGGIWAPQLKVTTGANQVDADHTQVTPIAGIGAAGPMALDVSALGGMYANKIQLLGTEHGLGVRNAGTIGAQVGELIVTVDGRLENSGNLQSQADTTVIASGGIANAGTISANKTLVLDTPQDLDNSGGRLDATRIAVDAASLLNRDGAIAQTGAQGLVLQAGSLVNQGGVIGRPTLTDENGSAGGSDSHTGGSSGGGAASSSGASPSTGANDAAADFVVPSDGVLHIAGVLDNSNGTIRANSGFDLSSATGLSNDGGQLSLRQLVLTGGDLSNRGGSLTIDGAASILADRVLNDAGQLNFGDTLAFNVQSLSNRGGEFTHAGSSATTLVVAGTLDNTDGVLASNASKLMLSSGALVNERGMIQHGGAEGFALTTGVWQGAGGTAVTAGAAVITAETIDHRGATLSAAQLTLNAATLDNRGGLLAASGEGANALTVTGVLDNSDHGSIQSNGDLILAAHTLGNASGTIQHAGEGALNITTSTLNGQGGSIASNGALALSGGTIDLGGGATTARSARVDAYTLVTRGGLLSAVDSLSIRADTLDNSHTLAADPEDQLGLYSQHMALDVANIDNRAGQIQANGTLTIDSSKRLDNTAGNLSAMGATVIHAGDLINQGGTVQAADAPLTVNVDHLLDNSAKGMLVSDGDLHINAATLDNTQGTIAHAGDGELSINAAALNGAQGTIASQGRLALTGGTLDVGGGTTYAQRVFVDADTLTTAGGSLQSLGGDPLALHVRGVFDNSGGSLISNGALSLYAGTWLNQRGTAVAAGEGASRFTVAGLFDNSDGVLGTAGATTLQAGAFDNTAGTFQAASDAALVVSVDGQLVNDKGALVGNGDIDLTVGGMSNRAGTVQTQQAITARVASTWDNTGGAVVAGGNLDVKAGTLINRDDAKLVPSWDTAAAADGSTPALGLHGQQVTLQVDTLDNTRGTVQARDALTVTGGALTNAGGVLDGAGAVHVSGSYLDNTAGQLIQRGAAGSLSLAISGQLTNALSGLIGAEGLAQLHAGAFDNRSGTLFAQQGLSLSSDGDLVNAAGGQLQSGGALSLDIGGTLDNNGGSVDAVAAATIRADAITNVDGRVLVGDSDSTDASLQLTSNNAVDNRGGTLGNRGGDVTLVARRIDNGQGGNLVAQRDLNLNNVAALDNVGGTIVATRDLSYQNNAATFDNTGGTLGAGNTAWLSVGALTNASGRLQADTLWLTTPQLNNAAGDIGATTLHATLTQLDGLGVLHGTDLLDAHFLGDYTHLAGQQFQSDGVLSLTVDGTLTNQGSLQTQGELNLSAANLVNQGTIAASNTEGTASAHLSAIGQIDNQAGASINADRLALVAADVTNTSSQGIVGNTVRIDADTLTNGRDLGNADAAVAYGEGFIGAADYLDLHIGQRLANLDGELYSGGDMTLAGRADGARLVTLDNVSGRIQAEGNASIAADTLNNRRRFIETEQYTLSADEQYALSSERTYDNALTPAETQRMADLYIKNDSRSGLTIAERQELMAYVHRLGYVHVDQVDDATLAAMNATVNKDAIQNHGHQGAYIVVGTGGNPGAEAKQIDTYLTGTRVTRASAEAQILTGGDLDIDLGSQLTNAGSTIAATRNLAIHGDTSRIDNIAVLAQYTLDRETQVLSLSALPIHYWDSNGATGETHSDFLTSLGTERLALAGPTLIASTLSGQTVAISGRDINNTAVVASGGLATLDNGPLAGPGSTSLGNAAQAQAAAAGPVHGAQGDSVVNAGTVSGAGTQVVGSADQPLPGLVPPSNGKYSQNGEPGAPFLITTAPRFAKGASTSSDYLLRALGTDPANIHKRLGDGYYEQNLVLDQMLQLTGRRTLNGGDGLSQYQALMDGAAAEAGRLGLQLGAPLTTDQIASLSSDIVWLVDQVVDGQHVLVPVVYLSKSTADQLRSDGALLAGDNVDLKASGTVRNDGTISGTQGVSISADTLINRGTVSAGDRLAIATQGDTLNAGTLKANAIGIVAGGSVINAPTFDGIVAKGGVISAGTGGLQLVAINDVINQGRITSQGNGLIVAGRDYVQNAATSASGIRAPVGSLTIGDNAAVVAGRDAVFDQSTLSAGKAAYINAGRDAVFNAATISGGTGVGVAAGRDIISDAVASTTSTASFDRQGKTVTKTETTETTVRGSTFTSGGDITLQAGRDMTLTAATVASDHGNVALLATRDLTLNTAQASYSSTTDTKTSSGGMLSKTTTRTHVYFNNKSAMRSNALAAGLFGGLGGAVGGAVAGAVMASPSLPSGVTDGVYSLADRAAFEALADDEYERAFVSSKESPNKGAVFVIYLDAEVNGKQAFTKSVVPVRYKDGKTNYEAATMSAFLYYLSQLSVDG